MPFVFSLICKMKFTCFTLLVTKHSKHDCLLYLLIGTRNNSLETCTWLLLMLLQDLFASARLHRVHNFFLKKSAVHYLCHLKSNVIGQRKTTDKVKTLLSMTDFV